MTFMTLVPELDSEPRFPDSVYSQSRYSPSCDFRFILEGARAGGGSLRLLPLLIFSYASFVAFFQAGQCCRTKIP
jgi:hypothetical protein